MSEIYIDVDINLTGYFSNGYFSLFSFLNSDIFKKYKFKRENFPKTIAQYDITTQGHISLYRAGYTTALTG